MAVHEDNKMCKSFRTIMAYSDRDNTVKITNASIQERQKHTATLIQHRSTVIREKSTVMFYTSASRRRRSRCVNSPHFRTIKPDRTQQQQRQQHTQGLFTPDAVYCVAAAMPLRWRPALRVTLRHFRRNTLQNDAVVYTHTPV